MKTQALSVWILFLFLAALLAGCDALEVDWVQPTATPETTLTPGVIPASALETDWVIYHNADFGLAFQYPPTWQKPVEMRHTEEGKDRWIVVTIAPNPPGPSDVAEMPSCPEGT